MELTDETETVSEEVVVGSESGLHARPAAMVVALAGKLDPPVTLRKPDGMAVNARSIVKVLSQNFCHGDVVVVEACGEGAEESVRQMADLVSRELDIDDDDALKASD